MTVDNLISIANLVDVSLNSNVSSDSSSNHFVENWLNDLLRSLTNDRIDLLALAMVFYFLFYRGSSERSVNFIFNLLTELWFNNDEVCLTIDLFLRLPKWE